jgi:hypothetical protein
MPPCVILPLEWDIGAVAVLVALAAATIRQSTLGGVMVRVVLAFLVVPIFIWLFPLLGGRGIFSAISGILTRRSFVGHAFNTDLVSLLAAFASLTARAVVRVTMIMNSRLEVTGSSLFAIQQFLHRILSLLFGRILITVQSKFK